MNISHTDLPGVLLIQPDVFSDERGFFMESYNLRKYVELGDGTTFVQDNLSSSQRGTLRGLHYQHPQGQGKLVWVVRGAVFDVVVDIRLNSPTFGRCFSYELTEENKMQLWVPPGFAHGFCVVSDQAMFAYKCTDFYNPDAEHTILWNDPDLAINWPVSTPTISPKDQAGIRLSELKPEDLPK